MPPSSRIRLTATERSEQVLQAAVQAFSESGYAATRTDEIARRAGVSQPYVIRLFGTKQHLFIATAHRVCDRIEQVFRDAREQAAPDVSPQAALDALGHGYLAFLSEPELPRVLLHCFAASSEPAIGDEVRARFGRIYQLIRELSGAPAEDANQFLANGMLMTVMAAMQVIGPDAVPLEWAREIMGNFGEDMVG